MSSDGIGLGSLARNRTDTRDRSKKQYAMKVMTSFGYEIMLPRGFWFQTLDVNKPWRQIPADRLLFFFFFFFFLVFTNFFYF